MTDELNDLPSIGVEGRFDEVILFSSMAGDSGPKVRVTSESGLWIEDEAKLAEVHELLDKAWANAKAAVEART